MKPIKANYDKVDHYRTSKGRIVKFFFSPEGTPYSVFLSEDGKIYTDQTQYFTVTDPGFVPAKYRGKRNEQTSESGQ